MVEVPSTVRDKARAPTDVDVLVARRTVSGSEASAGRYALGVVLFLCAVFLPLLRQSGTTSWRTIWSEDGSIYFQQAHQHGALAVVLRGYAGYLQLPPRILGAISTLVPLRDLPLYFALAAQVVNALLAYFVYWASDGWITSRPVRLALASLVVLMPALGFENTATITNTIWTFAMVTPWALISLRERPAAVTSRSAVAFLAATSTPLAIVFVPLAVGYGWARKTRATWIVVGAFATGFALQTAVVTHTKDQTAFLPPVRQMSKVPELISVRVFAQFLLGDRGINAVWNERGLLAVFAPLLVLAIVAALLPGVDRRRQVLACSLVALAVASFVVPVWGRGTNWTALSLSDWSAFPSTAYRAANRFSVIPVMMLASAFALLAGGPRNHASRIPQRASALILVAQIALVSVIGYSITNARSAQPSWTRVVDQAFERQCDGERSDRSVVVRNTVFWGPEFPISVRCRDLAP